MSACLYNVGVLWANGWTDRYESWHAGSPGHGHTVLDGDPAPPPLTGADPQFSAYISCGQMAGWITMPLGREIDLSPSDIVLDRNPAPLPKRGRSSEFLAHVYCGQTAVWIKMPLSVDLGLNSGHIVLDGDPAPLPRRGTAPNFRQYLLWPSG